MKYYRIRMIHNDIINSDADLALPEGYYFRDFEYGDETIWADIETAAGEFSSKAKALKRFSDEFGGLGTELAGRCFFLYDENHTPIGTSMGWYDKDFQGEEIGRLHWIAIVPGYQGRGLGKPLVAKAIRRIQKSHKRAYLTSQTTSWKAINMYLDFGFRPLYAFDDCPKAWELLADKLKHPALGRD
ncbi:MAG TPA: GNAT family N-acetyltransferase [Clostridia bacterium]|nr:GNAT family N-acetyltransferase [Clostridia bacterium]